VFFSSQPVALGDRDTARSPAVTQMIVSSCLGKKVEKTLSSCGDQGKRKGDHHHLVRAG